MLARRSEDIRGRHLGCEATHQPGRITPKLDISGRRQLIFETVKQVIS